MYKNKLSFLLVTCLVVIFVAIIIGFSVYYFLMFDSQREAQNYRLSPTKSVQYYSKLDGHMVTSSAEISPRVVAVMIDNHPDARPESGLNSAAVVYEAPVEGGLTRYMAVFNSASNVAEVGPVRSARPYFLDWLEEYGSALYVHCGGSPQALQEIKQLSIFDDNQFFNGDYFWRSPNRVAPHNLYTSANLWQKYLTADNSEKNNYGDWQGWKFLTSPRLVTAGQKDLETLAISIPFGSDYRVEWKYNKQSQRYERYINGRLYLDKSGSIIAADNVILQYVEVATIDDDGRKEITTVGSGAARVVSVGRPLVSGNWRKVLTGRTRWYDANNQEISLVPGVTWVEVLPHETNVGITN